MGVFSWIKNAVAKVFGIGKATEEESAEKSDALREAINSMEFVVSDLSIEVNDDAVKIWAEAADLATKEKVVLVAVNANGVAFVEDNMSVAELEVIEEAAMAQFHTVASGDTLG
jgi:hypothetical protein